MATCDAYFVGVDVGTQSVRAMLVNDEGRTEQVATRAIDVFNPQPGFYEQSSAQIWNAVCHVVQSVAEAVDKSQIKGIGFDATCSMVILDCHRSPLCLSGESQDNKRNIIMWMDHRAKAEAEFINSTKHEVLKYVGGKLSLEMQIPKLLWIKTKAPDVWSKAGHFFDLPDFLTFKATGKLTRSLCSLVCKWTYINDDSYKGWSKRFFNRIGLPELATEQFSRIGNSVLAPGDLVGNLSEEAASELGLDPGTAVGASLIDAHAGGLSLVSSGIQQNDHMEGRLGLICGTSTCHMVVNKGAIFTSGVWGPYLSAMVPGLWLNEGGQSATGSLVDHVIFNHPAVKDLPDKKEDAYNFLEEKLGSMFSRNEAEEDVSVLAKEVHVYPDFHGNRSPLADPDMTGMITGLTLESGLEQLAVLYLATLQAVSYGTKDIVDQLETSGHHINTVLMCGGLTKSKLFIQTTADVLGVPVCIPHVKESVLLGAAILGATASAHFGARAKLQTVAQNMSGPVDTFKPNKHMKKFHENKFEVYKKMQKNQREYKEIMRK